MTSARKAFANRVNGRRGYAARSAAGKARQAAAVRRHGLVLPVLLDPALAPEVDTLAREIAKSVAGRPVDEARHALACNVAEAMIDLYRVRLAKRPLSIALDADPSNTATLTMLARLARYERRALSRRKFATREFLAAIAGADPAEPLRLRKFRVRRRVSNFGSVTQLG
ncbi:MAG TPA: hypothetical protein VKX28_24380 [Xanthobacteraceae bacterium]|nr:hypothetical protein [Xanthobacteraceae bacterium]